MKLFTLHVDQYFVRYILVGLATFTIYISISSGVPTFFSVSAPLMTAIAYLVSGWFNFTMHRVYTFSSSKKVWGSLWRYIIFLLTSSITMAFSVKIMVHTMHLSILASNFFCVVGSTIVSYFVLKNRIM